MHLSLNIKFIIAYLIFGLCAFLCISTVTSRLLLDHTVEEKASSFYQEGLYLADQYVATYPGDVDDQRSLSGIQPYLSSVDVYLNAEIWLISRDGNLVLSSADTEIPAEPREIPDFNSVLPGGKYYTTGDFFGMFDQETLSVLVPVTHNYHVRGYIAVHTPMSSVVQEKEGYLMAFYITLIILMALTFLFAAAGWFIVYRPLRKLGRAAGEYASGNFDYPIAMNREDELGILSNTMNFMAQALRDADEDQRKMISNISHDFRSPLTSIKGYIEAMLDGTIPPEMQEKYLNIVLFETDRLNKLTRSMLALNRMDNKGFYLDIRDFDINTVIKNTAASFEGTCTAKRISIELLLSAEKLYVSADKMKIQQVLYNLIDNAIKFSPNHSTIRVETTERHDKVFVSVKDNGIGIPRASLSKIWERFYKIDASRGKDRKGTGLGLSIVREIISAHKQNINVISTEGIGTEFVFSLDRAKQENSPS